VGPVKVDFLNNVFMPFGAILTVVFENVALFGEKKSLTVTVCALVKKIINVFVNNSGTGRDISKIQTDSEGQKQFF
jgi:hypothetical protein